VVRIRTSRLILSSATFEQLTADLLGGRKLAAVLAAHVPETWPPDLYDAGAVQFALDGLRGHGLDFPWGFYYLLLQVPDAVPTLIGAGGFKGPPDEEGQVEIGYAVLPEFRRNGYAAEAVRAWIHFAFSHGAVARVVAQTLSSLPPSIRVAESAGMRLAGFGADAGAPAEEEVLRYEITRADFESER